MEFSIVDALVKAWALRNGLPLSTRYKDSDVRSVQLAGSGGRAQIWIEVDPDIVVRVWDYRREPRTLSVGASGVERALDEALAIARSWCDRPMPGQ